MAVKPKIKRSFIPLLLAIIFGLIACGTLAGQPAVATNASLNTSLSLTSPVPSQASPAASMTSMVYIPLALDNFPWVSPFGVETSKRINEGSKYSNQAIALNGKWMRMGRRISWLKLQPNEGDLIQWDVLVNFENELQALKAAGITPIVIIYDSPAWATDNSARNDGQPTSCGPIRSDKFNAFADFVRQVVERYKGEEFGVRHWELGNEPDVDPNLLPPNYSFGCWGDIDDTEYYGGRRYGEMLKVVGKVIKEADPFAKVWIGGLLLDSPNTTTPGRGKPELFFKGVLQAGAAPYFDIVAYHWYPPYLNKRMDYDAEIGLWKDWGGGTVGKARYLRSLMAPYGVSKPLFLNETSLMCPPTAGGSSTNWCEPPSMGFYEMQADFVGRAFVRGLAEGVMGFTWYTLNGPGWRYTGLLNEEDDPVPTYIAYQQLISQLQYTKFLSTFDYGSGIEAYAFKRGPEVVHILWTIKDQNPALTFTVPKSKYKAAYDRDGNALTPTLVGNTYELEVGFSPVYVVRKP